MTRLRLFKRVWNLEADVARLQRQLEFEQQRRYAEFEMLVALMEHLHVVYEKPEKGRMVPDGKRVEPR